MGIELIGALVIGLTLGLLGSGGSAITVPVLVYLVGHGAKQSIAESMAIVGMISVAVAIPYAKSKLVDWRNVWYFGIPGMLGTLIGAWLGGIAADAMQLAPEHHMILPANHYTAAVYLPMVLLGFHPGLVMLALVAKNRWV